MIYKYAYNVVATCEINNIVKKPTFDKKQLKKETYEFISNTLQEYFYYGINDDEIEQSYDVDFIIHTSSNSYEIVHKVPSNNPNIIKKIMSLYEKNTFNLNEIICANGCELEDIYKKFGLEQFEIKNTCIQIELIELVNEFDSDFDISMDFSKIKFIELYQ